MGASIATGSEAQHFVLAIPIFYPRFVLGVFYGCGEHASPAGPRSRNSGQRFFAERGRSSPALRRSPALRSGDYELSDARSRHHHLPGWQLDHPAHRQVWARRYRLSCPEHEVRVVRNVPGTRSRPPCSERSGNLEQQAGCSAVRGTQGAWPQAPRLRGSIFSPVPAQSRRREKPNKV